MKLRAFVKADKEVLDAGAWTDKRLPKTGGKFPLSRTKNFRVGADGWRWRVTQVRVNATEFRVLSMYHTAKQNFLALVGEQLPADLLVIGSLEYHSTHPGWHLHASCDEPARNCSGRLRYPGMRRVEGSLALSTAPLFPTSDVAAAEIGYRYLGLPKGMVAEPVQSNIPFSRSALE